MTFAVDWALKADLSIPHIDTQLNTVNINININIVAIRIVGPVTLAHIWMCAVHTKGGQAQTSLH